VTSGVQPTVGVIIIGDEILKGSVIEANAAFFIERFRAIGAHLREIAVIPDEPDLIALKVRSFSDSFDYVCTTGGIGPTHDDYTVAAVAQAFGLEMEVREDLIARMREVVGDAFNEGHRRLAQLPCGARLVSGPGLKWPVLAVNNVFIFPGVPGMLRTKFAAIESNFQGRPYSWAAVTIRARETQICAALDLIVEAHPKVNIGSYPRLEGGEWILRLTVDGFDESAVCQAHETLQVSFQDSIISIEELSLSNAASP